MSEEEAEALFCNYCEELADRHDPLIVVVTYNQFRSDLQLMDWLEWLQGGGIAGHFIAAILINISKQEKLDRVGRTWEDLITLDTELDELIPPT